MLQFVLGRAGYGKSTHLLKEIEKRARRGEKSILIVPEQFSFETERSIYYALSAELARHVWVLSFSRLCEQVLVRFGAEKKIYLSEGGKNVLLSLALTDASDALEVYKRSKNYPGFLQKVGAMLTQFRQSGVHADALFLGAEQLSDERLAKKLSEFGVIYEAYQAYLKKGYRGAEDDIEDALAILHEEDFFNEYHIFIDEFKGFTKPEIDMIGIMLTQAQGVTVSLCMDQLYDEQEGMSVFSYLQKTGRRLMRVAKEHGVTVLAPIVLDMPHRYRTQGLCTVESELFETAEKNIVEADGSIRCLYAKTPYEEMKFVAAEIRRLVQEEGYRYKEIAIVGRAVDDYKNPLQTMLARYEIPYFYSMKKPLIHSPLAAFLRGVLRAGITNYDVESIFSALRTGFFPHTTEEISLLENYVYLWNVRGGLWESPFVQNPRGFTSMMTDEDVEELALINTVRESVVGLVSVVRGFQDDASGGDFAQMVYELLEQANIEAQISSAILEVETQEEKINIRRTWEIVMTLLSEFHMLLSNIYPGKPKLFELFEMMILQADTSDVPQTLDQVLVGNADLVRASDVRALFVVGANEGVLPALPEETSLLTSAERELLMSVSIELADNLDERAANEEFIAYKTLTTPSEKLYLSAPSFDTGGGALYPSRLFGELAGLFSGLTIEEIAEMPARFFASSQKGLYYTYTEHFREKSVESASLEALIAKENPEFLARLTAVAENRPFEIQDKVLSKQLFGESMRLSPTGVERFYNCAFAYFASHGLRISKPLKAEMSPLVVGNLVHYALQFLLQKFSPQELMVLSEEALNTEIRIILTDYLSDFLGGEADKTARFKYLYTRIRNTLRELITQLAREFSQSLFEPVAFELAVEKEGLVPPLEVRLPEGGRAYIEGVIDRVDLYQKGREKYVRVVDYKTGAKEFKLSEIYYGLNLQMLVYLFSIWKNGTGIFEDALPAGVLYMPARTSALDLERDVSEEKLLIERQKTFRMNGILLEDADVIVAMEEKAEGVFIPATLNKDGSVRASASVASLAELGKLSRYVETLLRRMGTELHAGNIAALPIKEKQMSACDYCQYRSICGHENADTFTEIASLDKNTFYEKMKGE